MNDRDRKIIQICHSGKWLYALCSDGSVWFREPGQWRELEGIFDEDTFFLEEE